MWLSAISVLGNKITFKLDTGAEASVLPLKVFNCLRDKPMLSNTATNYLLMEALYSHQLAHVSLNVEGSLLLLLLDFLSSLKKFNPY